MSVPGAKAEVQVAGRSGFAARIERGLLTHPPLALTLPPLSPLPCLLAVANRFLQEVREADDPFQAVASMFSRGVFSQGALAASAEAATAETATAEGGVGAEML